MIASLYQSGSAAVDMAAVLTCASTLAPGSRRETPNGKWNRGRVETNALQLAPPSKCGVAHQIANRDRGAVGELPLPQRHLDRDLVGVKRIEIDRYKDHVSAVRRDFAVK